jgi:hypothetical protein
MTDCFAASTRTTVFAFTLFLFFNWNESFEYFFEKNTICESRHLFLRKYQGLLARIYMDWCVVARSVLDVVE